ncbi:MAG: hypothetical protein J7L45_03065 [Candidatus Aenigmarchaeota archaeon]|nr:hypothetical protein [Candidatus Aenigmarchaeota archaeon]
MGEPSLVAFGKKIEEKYSLISLFTPDRIVINPVTHQRYAESTIGWFDAVDGISTQMGIFGMFYPVVTLYKWIDSYIVPREVLPSEVDYGMPEYTSPGERKSLYGDLEPKYSQRRLERKYYKYVNRLLKDLEKANKRTKKYISKGMEKKLKEIEKDLEKYEQDYVTLVDGLSNPNRYKGLMG